MVRRGDRHDGHCLFLLRPLLDGLQIAGLAGRVDTLPGVAQLALAVLVFDLISYAVHRGLHQSDLLGSIHKVGAEQGRTTRPPRALLGHRRVRHDPVLQHGQCRG